MKTTMQMMVETNAWKPVEAVRTQTTEQMLRAGEKKTVMVTAMVGGWSRKFEVEGRVDEYAKVVRAVQKLAGRQMVHVMEVRPVGRVVPTATRRCPVESRKSLRWMRLALMLRA